MNIPEEAVEAAARVRHDTYRRAVAERVGDGAPTTPWENIPERWRSEDREAVRVYLEAAAPFIAAQALRDAADLFAEEEGVEVLAFAGDFTDVQAVNAVDTWLRERADLEDPL